MKSTLYILSHGAGPDNVDLLPSKQPGENLTVILVDEALSLTDVPADRVYALSEEGGSGKAVSSHPQVSYADMVKMIFEAHHVVAL